jgi:hypothetical protein
MRFLSHTLRRDGAKNREFRIEKGFQDSSGDFFSHSIGPRTRVVSFFETMAVVTNKTSPGGRNACLQGRQVILILRSGAFAASRRMRPMVRDGAPDSASALPGERLLTMRNTTDAAPTSPRPSWRR